MPGSLCHLTCTVMSFFSLGFWSGHSSPKQKKISKGGGVVVWPFWNRMRPAGPDTTVRGRMGPHASLSHHHPSWCPPHPRWSPCAGWCPPMPPYLPIPAWCLHTIRSLCTSWCPPIPAWSLRPTPCPQRAQGGNPVLLSPLRNPSRLKSLVFFSLSMGLGPPQWVAQGPVQKTLHWQRRMA